jgi:hypothetical protein
MSRRGRPKKNPVEIDDPIQKAEAQADAIPETVKTDEYKLSCRYCKRECSNIGTLGKHETACHKNPEFVKSVGIDEHRTTCSYCHKKFYDPIDRDRHEIKCQFNPDAFTDVKLSRSELNDRDTAVSQFAQSNIDNDINSVEGNPYLIPKWQRDQINRNKWRDGTRHKESAVFLFAEKQKGWYLAAEAYENYLTERTDDTSGKYILTKHEFVRFVTMQLKYISENRKGEMWINFSRHE